MKAISDFPVPTCKRQLMRFLGMADYYRKFCDNFSVIAEPLTNLLSKRTQFIWTNDCQKAFDIPKAILKNEPVLLAPNFLKEFKLAVDASDTGAGSVLIQEDGNGVDHPVRYEGCPSISQSTSITFLMIGGINEILRQLWYIYSLLIC